MQSFQGLTSAEAKAVLLKDGPNRLSEEKKNIFTAFLKGLATPVSFMLLAAAILSLVVGKTVDFWVIIALFLSNSAIGLWHEHKADTSIKELQKHLTIKVRTLRNGTWQSIDSADLVVGDIIELHVGMIVPADIVLIEAKNLSINESVLTGESLPKEKNDNDQAYSGSFVTTGEGVAKVSATGERTFFGKTIASIDVGRRQSSLEKDILSISKFISITSVVIVAVLTVVLFATHANPLETITLDLSLLIAGIPVALPTVMSLIISFGVVALSKKQVIVRRLASLEELANVDLLLSDKTGTLTQNVIQVESLTVFDGFTENEIILLARSAVSDDESNPIDHAVINKVKILGDVPLYKQADYTPGDSIRKRSTSVINYQGSSSTVSLGAPQVIESLCDMNVALKQQFDQAVAQAGSNGYRVLALAINQRSGEEKNMQMAGLLFLADHLHDDAKSTIAFMNENGISVKMVTGDSLAISARISQELGLVGNVSTRNVLDEEQALKKNFDSIACFSEVLPKDKYALVSLARLSHTVAVTGDGINDLPAIKNADVGFAVSNAVDALKGSADIVLLKNGIAVIKDAIIEARKIFTRLYNYSLYRISESFRLIITIAVIGIIYKAYPLTPVQIIVLAFLNDIPIISLAFDRVKTSTRPSHVDAKKRFGLSTLFGISGTVNSLVLLFIMLYVLHLPWIIIQTVFFLKLTVSGHMLVYVAHTEERWWKFLPSKAVIFATIGTQIIATVFALAGILTAPIAWPLVVLIWVWAFAWMQVSEGMKILHQKFFT